MIINLVLFIIFELASGFCNTLPQFLGVRSLYGIAMGGKSSYTVLGGRYPKFGGLFSTLELWILTATCCCEFRSSG
jgi:MFS family permease